MGRRVGHFEIIPRKTRIIKAERKLRHWSKLFRTALADQDQRRAEQISDSAWNALLTLFEGLRNERDHGYLDSSDLQQPVGLIISLASSADQAQAFNARKIDRSQPDCSDLTLAEALNKLAHYDAALSTFRVDRRGAHYLVLSGKRRSAGGTQKWIAEILITRLCREIRAAARNIRDFPRRS